MTRINQVMADSIHYCYEDEDSAQALRMMSEQQIHQLTILSRSQELVEIVSLGDLANKRENAATSHTALRQVSS